MSSLAVPCYGEDRQFLFEPKTTALLVIDMQRHFLADIDVGHPADPSDAAVDAAEPEEYDEEVDEEPIDEYIDMREIIPRVARLIATARRLGCKIVHTREGYAADLSDVSGFRRELDYVGHESPLGRILIRGAPGHDFVDELQPLTGELIIDKASFGAFYETELHQSLKAEGITHLLLCGVTTQCCVHSTLREAVDRGYWCLTVADCCAASEAGLHEAALQLIAGEGHLFGWIADLAAIEGAAFPK